MATSADFYEAGRLQRECAACGALGLFEVHHVVRKQELRDAVYWDPRNALRLCEGLDTNRCHGEHTNAKRRVRTDQLKDWNICFIFEKLGPAGRNLLEREYSGVDRRYTLHEEGACRLCQRP